MADELETMKDWIAKKQTNSTRITPAKKDKVFETKVNVSADPQNPTVAKIIEALNNNQQVEAKSIADNSGGSQFLNEFISEYIVHLKWCKGQKRTCKG
jgi:hypothetical protein